MSARPGRIIVPALALFLSSLAFFTSALARAGTDSRTYYVGSIGRASDSAARDPENWLKHELEDWKGSATGTTLVTAQRCGLDLKFRLIGTRRRNFVELEAQASADAGTVRLEPARIEMAFGQGPARAAAFSSDPGTIELQAGDRVFAAIPFPEKSDFLGQDEIQVRVPAGSCEVRAVFKRPAGQPGSAASGTVWSGMQLGLELGAGVLKTGDLKSVTENGLEFSLTVTRYPWINHGFWVGFEFQNLGRPNSVSGLGVFLGYGFRHYLTSRWTIHAELAPGVYEFAYTVSPQQPQALDHAFALGLRVGVDWIFGRVGEPAFLESDHALGLLIADDVLPWATLSGNPASGQNISLQFRYLFGI